MGLQQHEKNIHIEKENEEKSKFPCKYCNKTYKTSKGLSSHEKSHAPVTHFRKSGKRRKFGFDLNSEGEKMYPCKYCEKTYSDSSPLFAHMRKVHMKMSFKCEQCGNSYASSGGLHKHQKEQHGVISS